MTDVLKIAVQRRAALQEEIAKIEDFIRMAEALMREPASSAAALDEAPTDAPVRPARVPEAEPERRRISGEDSFSAPTRPQVIRRAQQAATAG